jgi:hypothetical protein
MRYRLTWHVLVAWAIATLVGCRGCEERAEVPRAALPVKPEPKFEALDIPLEPQNLLLDPRLLSLSGEVDAENRYPQAVMMTVLSGQEEVSACTGTAISPNVVLTAGHCVCTKRPLDATQGGSPSILDASHCFEAVKVDTLFYTSQPEPGFTLRDSRGTVHEGRVEPHPSLKVVLDEQGRVSSSHADLALVFLSRPLEFPGLSVADEEFRLGEAITIVGYGYDELVDVFGSERRFSTNKVTRLTQGDDERVLIEQPGGHRYRQDSGGPCLREGAKGPQLVGISGRWLGEGAACLSLHGYQGWLREAVQRTQTQPDLR